MKLVDYMIFKRRMFGEVIKLVYNLVVVNLSFIFSFKKWISSFHVRVETNLGEGEYHTPVFFSETGRVRNI